MKYWVYILAKYKDGKFSDFYVQHTNNLIQKICEHYYNDESDELKLVWFEECETKARALRLKSEIRPLNEKDKFGLINKQLVIKQKETIAA
jgi:predicted GIY-YIG superfamily endonuclease